MIKLLGSGQYGKVQLVVNVADLQPYAIKTVSKAKLRTSIRRIRSSLSRHSYGSLNVAASQAVAAITTDPACVPEKAPPPTDSHSSTDSAPVGAVSSPYAGLPSNIPGSELFASAPPNSRFGGRSQKAMQPAAEDIPAAAAAATIGSGDGAESSDMSVNPVSTSGRMASPFATRPKAVSPFAAAAQASLKILTASPDESPEMTTSGVLTPRLRSTLGYAQLDLELNSLGTVYPQPASPQTGFASPQTGFGDMHGTFGAPASPSSGYGDMHGLAATPRSSLAERPMPRPSVERVAQLRGYGSPLDSDSDASSGALSSPRNSLGDRSVPRPSLEHIAHLRGFARTNSTPNTGLADSFTMSRSASIRATPRAADVVQEIAVMKKLNHPNIVRLYEVCTADYCSVVAMQYVVHSRGTPHLSQLSTYAWQVQSGNAGQPGTASQQFQAQSVLCISVGYMTRKYALPRHRHE